MDRFIADENVTKFIVANFKIQYGQIYRLIILSRAIIFELILKSSMDRFIESAVIFSPTCSCTFKIQYGQIYRIPHLRQEAAYIFLKSSMDRFIVDVRCIQLFLEHLLKSSMDRFIAATDAPMSNHTNAFKIQYGQIYSCIPQHIDFHKNCF